MTTAMTTRAALTPAILRDALNEAYAGPAWHGPSVRAALRGVRADEALARPAAGRNNVWELALHLAYGRHLVIGRIIAAGGGGGDDLPAFPHRLRAPWWPVLPSETDERAWRATLALLDDYHRRLLDAVEGLAPAVLRARRRGRRHTIAQEVLGVALHDAYHAGQIRLVRLLAPRAAPATRRPAAPGAPATRPAPRGPRGGSRAARPGSRG